MRRSVATIVGTLAGTAMLVGAKLGTHPVTADSAAVAVGTVPAGQASAVPLSPSTGTVTKGGRGGSGGTKSQQAKPKQQATKSASGLKDGAYTGGGASERYGTITVSITVSGGKITKTSGTCSPCGGTSQSISNGAFPQLAQEALAAQNAHISTVSGATYTSGAYRLSLQSALDAAKA